MCLTIGFAMEGFAILATDTYTFGPELSDGTPAWRNEFPGGKLRDGDGGSFMTVSGGGWCNTALAGDPFPDFGDEDATRQWVERMHARAPVVRGLDSYLTTVFQRAGVFHVRAWSESGEVMVDSMKEREPDSASLAANFPRGCEDEDLKARLQRSFVKDVEAALKRPDQAGERIIGAVLNLFRRTREHTEFLGPVVDGVLLAAAGRPGQFGAQRFKEDVRTKEAAA